MTVLFLNLIFFIQNLKETSMCVTMMTKAEKI